MAFGCQAKCEGYTGKAGVGAREAGALRALSTKFWGEPAADAPVLGGVESHGVLISRATVLSQTDIVYVRTAIEGVN
jgi:hypothetical protein